MSTINVWSQGIDSLKSLLDTNGIADTTRVLVLADLSYELRRSKPDSSLQLATEALSLAEKLKYGKGQASAKRMIGIYYYLKADYFTALDHYQASLALSQKAKDTKNIANCYNNIGTIYHSQSDYKTALEYFYRSLEMRKKLHDTQGIIQCYCNIGSIFQDQGKYEKALEYYTNTLPLCKQTRNQENLAFTYHNLGSVHKAMGNSAKALEYSFKALDLRLQLNDMPGIIFTYNNIGTVYKDQGNYEKALEYFFNSLKLEGEIGNKQGMAASYHNIGILYKTQGNFEKAFEHFKNSLAIKNEIGNKRGIANSYYELGSLYQLQHDSVKAAEYLERARKIQETIGDKRGLVLSNSILAETYIDRNELSKVLPYLQEGLSLAKEIGSNELISELLTKYARYNNAVGDFLSALEFAKQARLFAEASGNAECVRNAAEQHYVAAAKLGRFGDAFESHRLFVSIRDSLQNEKNNRLVLSREFAFKEERARIEQEKKELQFLAAAENQRRILYSLAAVASALVVASLLIYFSYRQKQKANQLLTYQKKQIEQSNEELEKIVTFKNRLLSIISHDAKGPLNSLRGILYLFQQNALSQHELREVTADVGDQVSQVTHFLDNLLRWTKNHLGHVTPNPEMFSLLRVVDETTDLLALAAKSKNIHVASVVPPDLSVYADVEMIKLIVRNLVTNSIKFCNEGGSVKISARAEQQQTIVSVEDTGVGIKPGDLAGLFNESHLSLKGTKEEIGTGLGLSLCKEFVEKNGGTISATSVEGRGSCFEFTVPSS